jgi:RNA-directed DNA polymerase
MKKERVAELQARWAKIQDLGGPETYFEQELRKSGVFRRYRPNLIEKGINKNQEIKASRAERAKIAELRRYIWEAYTATHISHLGLDVYWNEEVGEDFFDPHDRLKRQEDQGLPELETVGELVEALTDAVPEMNLPMLRWLCYHQDVAKRLHYRHFEIPKKTGGARQIWAPLPSLKAIQRWILENIVEHMPIHGAAHGFVPGRSIFSNAEEHCNSEVLVGIDLKDFFPSFTFPRVKGIFRAYGYKEGISTLLALLCTEAPRRIVELEGEVCYVATGPRALPQGSPVSPALTNVASMRLDRRLSGYALKHGWRYTRYADDLSFSVPRGQSQADVKGLLKTVGEIVQGEGLRVHPSKTHVMGVGRRQEVTGLVVNGEGTPRVPKERRAMLRAALHNAQTGKEVELGFALEQLMGHAAFVYAAQPELGRKYIDAFSELL